MPRGMHKSRTFRRVKVRTPGGTVKTHHKRRKPSAATCPITGEKLKGVPRGTPHQIRKHSKSARRPQRPFGGVLSSRAMRQVIKAEVRAQQQGGQDTDEE